jgi:hypothetical protein
MSLYTLNATKNLSNYGLKIYGSTYDPCFSQGYMESKPNVSIIGSSCFIDYSSTNSISDLTYLKKLFDATPVGTTFSFTDGDYYDPDYNYTVDVSGVFSFESLTATDKMIVAGIVSGFTYSTNYKYYNKANFVDPPQYTTNYTGGATAQNYIQNNLTNIGKSFVNFGAIGSAFSKEEYIEISGSTYNSGKLKINSVIKLKDDRELIYTDTTLQNEDRSTQNSTLTLYLRGNANPEILSKSKINVGCYVVYDSTGNQIECFENQNQLQAFLRSQFLTGSYTAKWFPCLYCSRITGDGFNASSSDKSTLYDSQIFAYVEEVPVGVVDASGNFSFNYSYYLKTNALGNENKTTTPIVNFTIDSGFKIDLSHPSLKGFSVNFYVDEKKSILMTENIYVIGIPGFDQSGILYTKTPSSSKTIYLEFTGPSVLEMQINVT